MGLCYGTPYASPSANQNPSSSHAAQNGTWNEYTTTTTANGLSTTTTITTINGVPVTTTTTTTTTNGVSKTTTMTSQFPDVLLCRQMMENPRLRVFSFSELKAATKNFKSDTVVGQGGFGRVFKGCVDADKKIVAIKKLSLQSLQGFQQWRSEVEFLGRLSHPNLVKLLGYCWEEKEFLLVYEFLHKGSLENHLFRRNPNIESLSWDRRLQIAIGAARGLAFLHTSNVIHRDFKTSNILLDVNYNAKIADFGLARLGSSGGDSHVSTRVMGTYGYLAPEYIATGHLYLKSDVYGFGVVLLQMLTGMRTTDLKLPNGHHSLVEWAKPCLSSKRKLSNIMDARMYGQYLPKAAMLAAQLTLNCLETEPRKRPSMKDVVEELEEIEAMGNRSAYSNFSSTHSTSSHSHTRTR